MPLDFSTPSRLYAVYLKLTEAPTINIFLLHLLQEKLKIKSFVLLFSLSTQLPKNVLVFIKSVLF